MHEVALCESILQIIEDESNKKGFTRVRIVRLEIGELSCVDNDALRFSFDVVMKHSVAEHAQLHIINVPGTARCNACEQDVGLENRFDPCPLCGNTRLTITGGEQMRVKELEVE